MRFSILKYPIKKTLRTGHQDDVKCNFYARYLIIYNNIKTIRGYRGWGQKIHVIIYTCSIILFLKSTFVNKLTHRFC